SGWAAYAAQARSLQIPRSSNGEGGRSGRVSRQGQGRGRLRAGCHSPPRSQSVNREKESPDCVVYYVRGWEVQLLARHDAARVRAQLGIEVQNLAISHAVAKLVGSDRPQRLSTLHRVGSRNSSDGSGHAFGRSVKLALLLNRRGIGRWGSRNIRLV